MMEPSENHRNEQTAAIMARVSLEKQAREGYSLAAQVEIGTDIAGKFGLQTNEKYILIDDGYSNNDWHRPAINKEVELINQRKVVALIFTNSDRFARDVEGGLKIIREIRAAGGRIILGDLGEYRDESNFRLMLTIKLAIAEHEKSQIRSRSLIGTLRKVKEGHPFGRGKYGFVIKDGVIEPVIERLAIVKRIYNWADMGESLQGIVNALKALDVPPPKKNWNTRTVRIILQDITYVTGEWFYNRRHAVVPKNPRKPDMERHRKNITMQPRPKSEWIPFEGVRTAPVIDRDQYDRIQARLAANIHVSGGRPSDTYLLTGLVWHEEDNHRMCGSRRNRTGERWYRCGWKDYDSGRNYCHKTVDADLLEQFIWDAMMDTLGDADTLTKLVEAHMENEKATTAEQDTKKLQQRIAELRQVEFQARREELHTTESETAKFYRHEYSEAMGQRRALEQELSTAIGHKARGTVDAASIARDIERVRKSRITEARPEKKELFKLWVSRIDYSSTRREADITLRIPIVKNATRIPGGVLQKSELRQCPFRRGMGGDVVVKNLAGPDLHDDEDVEGAECGGDHHEEVAGYHDLGMVADKSQPALFRVRRAHWTISMEVLADGARGDLNGQLELQFIGDAFLSPGGILCGHLADESAQILGDLRSAHRPGLPAPEEAESLAVPAKEGIGLDVHQGVTPEEHAPQNDHNQSRGIVGPVWLYLPLLEQGELFAQEQVLGSQCAAGPGNQHEETDEIAGYG